MRRSYIIDRPWLDRITHGMSRRVTLDEYREMFNQPIGTISQEVCYITLQQNNFSALEYLNTSNTLEYSIYVITGRILHQHCETYNIHPHAGLRNRILELAMLNNEEEIITNPYVLHGYANNILDNDCNMIYGI